jgi:uncharacterized protein
MIAFMAKFVSVGVCDRWVERQTIGELFTGVEVVESKPRNRTVIVTRAVFLTFALAACGSAPAGSVEAPAEGARAPRIYPYFVSNDQLAPADSAGFLEVSGTGQVAVEPGRAEISFTVETEAPRAQDAVRENADLMSAIMAALREERTGLDLETHGYDLQPRYRRAQRSDDAPKIVGYTARNQLRVSSDDVDSIGELIDVATGAGANRVASLRFLPVDVEAARLEALARAVASAQREAETIAAALGVPLGPPLEVRGRAETPQPRVFRQRAALEAATPVEASTQIVRATVTIRYRLGGE